MKTWMVVCGVLFLISAKLASCQEETEGVEEDTSEVPEENDVLVLSESNFDDVVAKYDTLLVEFYAPWCGHCKQLAPEYEKAAAQLKEADPKVMLGKVDATIETSLGTRFEVKGYPTLKFYKNGKMYDFDGPRDAAGIVSYMSERASPGWQPPPEAVVTLTNDNFDEVVNNEDLILVEFYAPWCGHCKKLAPEYEAAAQRLKEIPEPIILAKVDATVETELASRFEVTGYPSLKMFRRGVEYEYKGGRERYPIMEYMVKQQGSASKLVTGVNEARKAILGHPSGVVLGLFESEDDSSYQLYSKSVNEFREDYKLIHAFDKDTRDLYKANAGSVLVIHPEKFHTKYEPKWLTMQMEDGTTEKDIAEFITANNVPLVGHHEASSKKFYGSRRPLVLMFYTVDFGFDHREATQRWRLKLADIAKDYKDMTFAVADEEGSDDIFKEFGFMESGEEINIGIMGENNKKYPMEFFDSFDADDVRDFIERFRNGDVKPIVRSQPIPKKTKSSLKTLVGKNFEEIVLDKSKDVLVEFYAPWCGHCKSFEPKYKEFAKGLKKEKNLVIAKIDATANDYPEAFKVEGFPTILLAPAGSDQTPIKYEGNRDEDDLMKFLKENTKASFKSKKVEL